MRTPRMHATIVGLSVLLAFFLGQLPRARFARGGSPAA